MAVNTTQLESYTVFSSISLNGSGATLLATDIVASTISGSGTNKFAVLSASTLSGAALTVQAGSSTAPSVTILSEVSLGLYRSASSTLAMSYGTFKAPGGVVANAFMLTGSSATTAQSGATAKLTDGLLYFSVLSLTSNGGEFGFRSGNTVYRFSSVLAG